MAGRMVQGSGSAGTCAVVVAIAMLAFVLCGAQAATYSVGGSTQWDYPPSNDINWYNDVWAKNITFQVGDSLVFSYTVGAHNVWELATDAEYQACSLNAVAKYATGKDTIALTKVGTFYYICGVIGHCSMGMKLKVTVTGAATAPTAAPKLAPAPTPALTPALTPTLAPAPAPTTATPAPSPSPTTNMATPIASPSANYGPAGSPAASPPSSAPAALAAMAKPMVVATIVACLALFF